MLMAFALPTVILGIMHGPEGLIQGVYAKHAGISLSALAVAMLLTKVFDAVTYPLIGYLSDRTFARTGSRRLWFIAGTVLSVIGVWFLLRPPADVTVVWFGAWMAVTYLGWKVIEIPLQALSYTLSADYRQRARVQGWRGMAQVVGQLLFFLVPFVALQFGITTSTEVDFRSLGFAAILCAVALPLATLLLILRVPEHRVQPRTRATDDRPQQAARASLRTSIRALRDNPPLLRLFAAFLPVNLLAGMSGGLSYLYMDTYLGIGEHLPTILGISLLTSIIAIPFWTLLSARFERHRVWAYALIIGGIACGLLAFISPGPFALIACFILFPIVTLVLSGSIVVYTMSADIVDYGKLRTGTDHGGLYASMFAFLQKSLLGVSAALGLALVDAFGFDATATAQTTLGALGVKLGFGVGPALGFLLAALIIWGYPLNRRRVAQVQAALAKRQEASLAIAAEHVTFGLSPRTNRVDGPAVDAVTESSDGGRR